MNTKCSALFGETVFILVTMSIWSNDSEGREGDVCCQENTVVFFFFLVGVHAVIMISNLKIEKTGILIVWLAPPGPESDKRKSGPLPWHMAHCSKGVFFIWAAAGMVNLTMNINVMLGALFMYLSLWDPVVLKRGVLIKHKIPGVTVVVQLKQIWLKTMRLWVQSPASLSGLRIWHCHELWSRLQTQLRSCVAVALT